MFKEMKRKMSRKLKKKTKNKGSKPEGFQNGIDIPTVLLVRTLKIKRRELFRDSLP
jgi:hypothetical protein